MSKSTKYFELFSALRAGGDKGVSPDALKAATGFNQGALAVYIHALRHNFGAVIESVRNGRTIVAYRLTNADEVKITAARKPRTVKAKAAKPVKGKKTVIARVTKTVKTPKAAKSVKDEGIVDLSDMEISEYTSDDLNDIRMSLGI